MLKIYIPPKEGWDDLKEEFISFDGQQLCLEHSLVSLSKWEAQWHKPFISKEQKTRNELISYVRCMTITQNVKDYAYNFLTNENIKTINDYLADSHTATWFSQDKSTPAGQARRNSSEQITSELIYYWMIVNAIPFDPCEKWNLNRLMTLIRICTIKNAPGKKMKPGEILKNQSMMNKLRRAKLGTRG